VTHEGVCHQIKQKLNLHDHQREQPKPPRSLRRQTIWEFVEGGLIVNERDVTTPTAADNESLKSVPHIAPSTPHVCHHHRPLRHHLHSHRNTHQQPTHLHSPEPDDDTTRNQISTVINCLINNS